MSILIKRTHGDDAAVALLATKRLLENRNFDFIPLTDPDILQHMVDRNIDLPHSVVHADDLLSPVNRDHSGPFHDFGHAGKFAFVLKSGFHRDYLLDPLAADTKCRGEQDK